MVLVAGLFIALKDLDIEELLDNTNVVYVTDDDNDISHWYKVNKQGIEQLLFDFGEKIVERMIFDNKKTTIVVEK